MTSGCDGGRGLHEPDSWPVPDHQHSRSGMQSGMLDCPRLLLDVAANHQGRAEATERATGMAEGGIEEPHHRGGYPDTLAGLHGGGARRPRLR